MIFENIGSVEMIISVCKFFQTLFDIILSKVVALELIKAFITAILGFITFKIYQRYRNKKENSLLYVQVIKLKRELDRNINLLNSIIKEYTDYEGLAKVFKISQCIEIDNFYKVILSLGRFKVDEPCYEQGEIVDMNYSYSVKQYDVLNDLSNAISMIGSYGEEYEGQIDDLEYQLKELGNENIFVELKKIETQLESLVLLDFEYNSALIFCLNEIIKFNSLSNEQKNSILGSFCSLLFEGENIFTNSLKLYKKLEKMKNELGFSGVNKNNVPIISLNFAYWKCNELELLAVYRPQKYLTLDDFYNQNEKIELEKHNKEIISIKYNYLKNEIYPIIIDIESDLNKDISFINKIFKNV